MDVARPVGTLLCGRWHPVAMAQLLAMLQHVGQDVGNQRKVRLLWRARCMRGGTEEGAARCERARGLTHPAAVLDQEVEDRHACDLHPALRRP